MTNDQFKKKYNKSKVAYMKRFEIGNKANDRIRQKKQKRNNKEIKKYGGVLTKSQRQKIEDITAKQYAGTAVLLAGNAFASTMGSTPITDLMKGFGAGIVIGGGIAKSNMKKNLRMKHDYYLKKVDSNKR